MPAAGRPATWREGAALRRYRPAVALALFLLATGAVLRIALWWAFGRGSGVAVRDLLWILPAGLLNDADEALYLLTPFVMYILLLPDRWYRSTVNRAILALGALVTLAGGMYLAVTEYYFFEEFSARFNLIAVDYLAYPNEVMGDLWAEYPVLVVLALAAGVALLLFAAFRRHFLDGLHAPAAFAQRLRMAAPLALLLPLSAAWYQADSLALSGNRVANEIAANGESSFFRALRTLDLDYRRFYRTEDDRIALDTLTQNLARSGGRFVDLPHDDIGRQFAANPAGLGRKNVVVVVCESFGAEFSRLYGSAQDLTPNFDAIARSSLWFSTVYASGTRTVRGLEAIVASFPPIPSVSILRRPGNEGIATWGGVMRANGYRTSFIYGGFGYFDNMNHFFGANGFDLVDRRQIDNPRFANIWGVSDQDLFEAALGRFDAEHRARRPIFSVIMTTSNHKPYTFPPGVPGVPEQGGGRAAGVRYADYALGEFLRNARQHPWFDDTVFVVVADHGARVYGDTEIPLQSYRIPLAIYAPRLIAPRRVDTVTAQIDVAPTVLGLLGLPYRAPFFGVDVLAHPQDGHVVLLSHNHDVALFRDGHMVVLGLDERSTGYRYEVATDRYLREPADAELERLAIAYYQVAFDLFRDHRYL